jgi:hypothetical protein
VKLRTDRSILVREGDKVTIDGRLVAIESTDEGHLTFEGIENESSILLDSRGLRGLDEQGESFLKLSSVHS